MSSVRYADGIRIDLAAGETVVADGESLAGDVNVVSHAHGDHLYRADAGAVVCSPLTADLARVRRDGEEVDRTSHPRIDLVNAGHVAGSRAALIDDGERTYCYTGDVSTRDRFYLEGFDPPDADVLVVESTYGKPEYVFPDQAETEARIVDWLDDTDAPVLLFGYSLGRAQKLQRLVNRSSRTGGLYVSEAIAALNRPIEERLGVDFGAERYAREVDLGPGDALVFPTQVNDLGFVDDLREEKGAVKAGFSGWAVDDSFRYRGDYDETFVLSDHCDFAELCALVEDVDPERVYTHHGFADAFADHVATDLGYEARSLKPNQATLDEF